MNLASIRAKDPADMYSAILNVPDHIREALAIGDTAPQTPAGRIRRVVILGMGGSAIGGDLLRSFVGAFPSNPVQVSVHRGYDAPSVDKNTLVIVSSYSGATEETLSAYAGARAGGAGRVLAITTGGEVEQLARQHRHALIKIPAGLQPRAALAYSFFPLLQSLAVHSGIFGADVASAASQGSAETISLITKLAKKYCAGDTPTNAAYKLAASLCGKIPVIYSASDRLDTVNLRWRGQIQENAKQVAFGNLLPEMNHNEINGWSYPPNLMKHFAVVFLRDSADHARVKTRLDFTKKTIAASAGSAINVTSQGSTLLARMFSLIYLGDWASYYLAAMNRTDPSPVPVIMKLKKHLAR